MSGMLFWGYDKLSKKGLSSGLNGLVYDAFGALLNEALLKRHPEIYSVINSEEAAAFDYYYFCDLDANSLMTAVSEIRSVIRSWEYPSEWQSKAKIVWNNLCEPWLLMDERLS